MALKKTYLFLTYSFFNLESDHEMIQKQLMDFLWNKLNGLTYIYMKNRMIDSYIIILYFKKRC